MVRFYPHLTIPGFDVIKQLRQDIMHTILEGVLQYETRHILHHLIEQNVISLSQLNNEIINHGYGFDKPNPLKETVFNGKEKYKLNYKAAQARIFLRLLPFYLQKFVDFRDEHIKC